VLCAEEATANSWLHNKENKMAKQWTNPNGLTFYFDDDKLNFDDWLAENPARPDRWKDGVVQHMSWTEQNPDKSDFENIDSICSQMTEEWMDYSNAISEDNYTP
jgi:hypothetical protein